MGNEEDISQWSKEKVADWFRENGYPYFEKLTKHSTAIDGARLLTLSEKDLREAPFCMEDNGEIDHLSVCIESLRNEQLHRYMDKLEQTKKIANGSLSNGHSGRMNGKYHTYKNSYDTIEDSEHQYVSVKMPLISGDKDASSSSGPSSCSATSQNYPVEKLKTLLALLYMMAGFVISVSTLQLVHERVPPMEESPPLPDVAFDLVPQRVEWAFNICEINGIVLTAVLVIVLLFHKHRSIVIRRIFFLLGTLYIYRSLTMYVTTLPVPGLHFKCAPKVHGKFSVMAQRAITLLGGGGLSVTGSHHLCGDYLFSGHTIILVLMYLNIVEYTPKRWWWLHWSAWLLAVSGMICILLGHEHYTIDIVVAYLIATRLFWTYHTMANTLSLKTSSRSNLWSRVWWYPIFRYFEGNVWGGGELPRQYEWPLPFPKRLKHVTIRRFPIKGV